MRNIPVSEMAQMICDTFVGVESVTEVPGNPTLWGAYLFEITGAKGRAFIYVEPETGAVYGRGEK
jgi:hypothetical protein